MKLLLLNSIVALIIGLIIIIIAFVKNQGILLFGTILFFSAAAFNYMIYNKKKKGQ